MCWHCRSARSSFVAPATKRTAAAAGDAAATGEKGATCDLELDGDFDAANKVRVTRLYV